MVWEGRKLSPSWFPQQPVPILSYLGPFQSHLIRVTLGKFLRVLGGTFLGLGAFVFWGMLISAESMALTTWQSTSVRHLGYRRSECLPNWVGEECLRVVLQLKHNLTLSSQEAG